MSQPLDMSCSIKPQGEIDGDAGEFWVNNPFDMLSGKHNFSAYENNKLLINRPKGAFVNLSPESGVDLDSDSRSAIAADFDRDGDIDLLVASVGGGPLRLFQNRIPHVNQRVRIDLRGQAGNPRAIGARVVVEVGDRQIMRDAFPSNGFMGQSPAELIVGLGEARMIDRITVRWPDGTSQSHETIPVTQVIGVTKGEENAKLDDESWMPIQ